MNPLLCYMEPFLESVSASCFLFKSYTAASQVFCV